MLLPSFTATRTVPCCPDSSNSNIYKQSHNILNGPRLPIIYWLPLILKPCHADFDNPYLHSATLVISINIPNKCHEEVSPVIIYCILILGQIMAAP